jgi:sulfite oxidase
LGIESSDPRSPKWRPSHDERRFVVHTEEPFNGGPPPWVQRESYVTPTERFFVRNHGVVPSIAAATYELEVTGLVERPLRLTLTDLAGIAPRVRLLATIACAGQRRSELNDAKPIVDELPWGAEAVGTAWWEGWSLVALLERAGVRDGARHVSFVADDEATRGGRTFGYGASIPLEKALAPEVLLVDRMNDAPLPAIHGAPLRVLVPGYIGARQVKWVRRIVVGDAPHEGYFQSVAYRLYPTAMERDTFDPSAGFELGELSVNCVVCTPRPDAVVGEGRCTVTGYAYVGGGRTVERVEVSSDGGATWALAQFDDPEEAEAKRADPFGGRWAWRYFRADVPTPAGESSEFVARAWDSAGQTQPATAAEVWNLKGYANNAWSRLRVRRRA